jgi:hypothetical protein
MRLKLIFGMLSMFVVIGCGTKRPVLYPNGHYTDVGEAVARQDIETCQTLAEKAGTQGDAGEELAARTGTSAVVGGATGAVVGAVSGSVGRGSLIGAAAGGTAALTSGLFRAREPDPIFMRFVEQCLYEKGYQVLGWR